MVVLKFRSESDAKDTIKKLKKMHKFTKELIECFEDKYDDDDDDDEYYRYDEGMHRDSMMERSARRYRRGM